MKPAGVRPLVLTGVARDAARTFVRAYHRHHRAPPGWLFGVGVADGLWVVGVAMVGRPVARSLDDGTVAEVTRCCVLPAYPNACSMLYGWCRREAKRRGYRRLITYTLASESGTSLRAAGWRCLGERPGGKWSCPSRPGRDLHPTGPKLLWEAPP